MRVLLLTAILALAACSRGEAGPAVLAAPSTEAIPVYGYEVVAAYPHDPDAYTQGLFWLDGALYESTGLEGRSSIRKVDLTTGQVLQKRDLPESVFGEGIVAWGDRLVSLTWQNQQGFLFNLATFEPEGEFAYPGEGWGVTHDGERLIMSDGSSQLRFLDPETLTETGRVDAAHRALRGGERKLRRAGILPSRTPRVFPAQGGRQVRPARMIQNVRELASVGGADGVR